MPSAPALPRLPPPPRVPLLQRQPRSLPAPCSRRRLPRGLGSKRLPGGNPLVFLTERRGGPSSVSGSEVKREAICKPGLVGSPRVSAGCCPPPASPSACPVRPEGAQSQRCRGRKLRPLWWQCPGCRFGTLVRLLTWLDCPRLSRSLRQLRARLDPRRAAPGSRAGRKPVSVLLLRSSAWRALASVSAGGGAGPLLGVCHALRCCDRAESKPCRWGLRPRRAQSPGGGRWEGASPWQRWAPRAAGPLDGGAGRLGVSVPPCPAPLVAAALRPSGPWGRAPGPAHAGDGGAGAPLLRELGVLSLGEGRPRGELTAPCQGLKGLRGSWGGAAGRGVVVG